MTDQQKAQQQKNPLAAPHPSIEHLNEAADEASAAAEKLDENDVSSVRPNQEAAVDALKKALEAMNQNKDNQCRNKGENQQQQQQNQQQRQQQDRNQTAKQDQGKQDQDKKDQTAMAQLPDDADDILNEEKENKKKRRLPASSGYRRVDRDW